MKKDAVTRQLHKLPLDVQATIVRKVNYEFSVDFDTIREMKEFDFHPRHRLIQEVTTKYRHRLKEVIEEWIIAWENGVDLTDKWWEELDKVKMGRK